MTSGRQARELLVHFIGILVLFRTLEVTFRHIVDTCNLLCNPFWVAGVCGGFISAKEGNRWLKRFCPSRVQGKPCAGSHVPPSSLSSPPTFLSLSFFLSLPPGAPSFA